jgi:hypothetical protein
VQAELDAWVEDYNHRRPHQAIGMVPPAQRFQHLELAPVTSLRATVDLRPSPSRGDGIWVARRASAVGVVCVNWQQVCLGVAAAGRNIDVWVTADVMQFFDGDRLLRTEQRNTPAKSARSGVDPGSRTSI